MRKVKKILLVGFGSIGKRHLENLRRLFPDAMLAILRNRENIGRIEGCTIVSNLDAALTFQPQVAFICSPSSAHLSMATDLAKAGIHLFIEKPLSNRLEGIAEFMEVVRLANIRVMIGYNLRFSPALLTYREIVHHGKYGPPLCISAEVGQYLPDWRPNIDYRSTVSSQSELGGGVLLELSHELDYLNWLFGKPISIFGQLLKVSNLEIDVEDLVLANICFDYNGHQLNGNVQLDFLQRKPYRVCKVICEHATIIWDAMEDRVELHQKDTTTIIFQGDKDRNHTYEREIIEFINCVETDQSPPISIDDGLKVLEVVNALRLSSDTGKVVYL